MSLLIGVPVILPPRDDVLASWSHRPHMVVVNGNPDPWWEATLSLGADCTSIWPGKNLGVARSWNTIFDIAKNDGLSHVALMSQGVVLDGGTERLASLVDEYADWRGLLTDFAWRVIVLSVKLWEQVGRFDERFDAYWEDSDYVRRMFLAGLHAPDNAMPKVGRDLLDGTATEAATLQSGLIDHAVYGQSHDAFLAKWGGESFKETYDRPDDPTSVNPTNNWDSHTKE